MLPTLAVKSGGNKTAADDPYEFVPNNNGRRNAGGKSSGTGDRGNGRTEDTDRTARPRPPSLRLDALAPKLAQPSALGGTAPRHKGAAMAAPAAALLVRLPIPKPSVRAPAPPAVAMPGSSRDVQRRQQRHQTAITPPAPVNVSPAPGAIAVAAAAAAAVALPVSTLVDAKPAADVAALTLQFCNLQKHCRALSKYAARMDSRGKTVLKLMALASTTLTAPLL